MKNKFKAVVQTILMIALCLYLARDVVPVLKRIMGWPLFEEFSLQTLPTDLVVMIVFCIGTLFITYNILDLVVTKIWGIRMPVFVRSSGNQ